MFTTVLDWPDDQYCYTSTNQAVWTFTKSPGKTLHHLFLQWFSASQPSPQKCQNWRLRRRTRQENWWLLYVYNVGMGTLTQRLLWRCTWFWWWPLGFRGWVFFQVNEICLHGSSKSFLISQDDKDSHNPMLIHVTTQEMTWNEARQYQHWQQTQARNQRRKEKQKANNRKPFQEQDEKRLISWLLIFSSILNVEATISMRADFYQQKKAQLRGDFTVKFFNLQLISFFTPVHRLFPSRDDVTSYFSPHTHLVWTVTKKGGYHLCSIFCRWYRLLSTRRHYHYIVNFYHCHTKLWLWSPGSVFAVFMVNCFS